MFQLCCTNMEVGLEDRRGGQRGGLRLYSRLAVLDAPAVPPCGAATARWRREAASTRPHGIAVAAGLSRHAQMAA